MNLEETRIESERVYDGALLHARRDRVRLPDGGESIREWIDHPGASAIIPVFEDGSTLLVRQYRYPARKVFWEIPAGKIDVPGESPEDVARRELEEETGWAATKYVSLGSYYPCIGYSNEVIHIFLAFGLTRGSQNLSEGEFVEPIRMPFATAIEKVYSGEVDDMKTISGLLLASRYLAEHGGISPD